MRVRYCLATGVGFRAPLTQADVDTIVDFYHDRSTTARIVLSPLANREAVSLVARRGFVVEKYANVMALDLSNVRYERDTRAEACDDPQRWAFHSARAFADGEEPSEAMLFISELMAAHPNVTPLMVRNNGTIAATACFARKNTGSPHFSQLPRRRMRAVRGIKRHSSATVWRVRVKADDGRSRCGVGQ